MKLYPIYSKEQALKEVNEMYWETSIYNMKKYPTYKMKQALKEAKEIEEKFNQSYPCLVEVQEIPAIHSIEVDDEGVNIFTHNHSTYQATSPQELAEILEAIQVLEDYLYV